MSSTKKWLTVDEAAEELGLHRSTVYNAVWRGDLPHIYVGRLIRINREVIEAMTSDPANALRRPSTKAEA